MSAFFFLKNGGFHKHDRDWSEEHLVGIDTFEEFVMDWLTEERLWSKFHFIPQYWYIQDCWGQIRVDFLGRYENLESDFHRICEILDIPAELSRLNTGNRSHNLQYHSSRTLEKGSAPLRSRHGPFWVPISSLSIIWGLCRNVASMNSMTHELKPTDSLCLGSDIEESFRSYCPGRAAVAYQGVQPEDGITISFESYDDDDAYEDDGEDLCGSLMAAWD